MLSIEDILKDLDSTQECINIVLDKKDFKAAEPYSDKIMKIMVWMMKNGYAEI